MKTAKREERKIVIKFVLILVASMILGAVMSIAAAAAILLCRRAKRDIDAWNGEDESIEQAEQCLNYSVVLANLMTVVNPFGAA